MAFDYDSELREYRTIDNVVALTFENDEMILLCKKSRSSFRNCFAVVNPLDIEIDMAMDFRAYILGDLKEDTFENLDSKVITKDVKNHIRSFAAKTPIVKLSDTLEESYFEAIEPLDISSTHVRTQPRPWGSFAYFAVNTVAYPVAVPISIIGTHIDSKIHPGPKYTLGLNILAHLFSPIWAAGALYNIVVGNQINYKIGNPELLKKTGDENMLKIVTNDLSALDMPRFDVGKDITLGFDNRKKSVFVSPYRTPDFETHYLSVAPELKQRIDSLTTDYLSEQIKHIEFKRMVTTDKEFVDFAKDFLRTVKTI